MAGARADAARIDGGPLGRLELRDLEAITPYEGNPRAITETAVEKVAASLKEFGWRQPIVVDGDGVIIAGHTRREAARRLRDRGDPSFALAPVLVADDLSERQVRAYRLADNRSGEETTWIDDYLARELQALRLPEFDMAALASITAFDPAEITRLLEVGTPASSLEADEEWRAMPEFVQAGRGAFRSLTVHFPDEAAVAQFEAALGITLGPRRWLWWPDRGGTPDEAA
jgi:ParB-like chromosome segregation protein Spo0J